ncbi:MAG: hypothetical protein HC767_09425 [Akkermansiaceae bacterium]|nr:hypothetical protein [Akkermansiaceae bacterium]
MKHSIMTSLRTISGLCFSLIFSAPAYAEDAKENKDPWWNPDWSERAKLLSTPVETVRVWRIQLAVLRYWLG